MGKLFLAYDNSEIQDGYFAQLQRQINIYHIAKTLRMGFVINHIVDVTVTQLDNFQEPTEITEYLNSMNAIYDFPSSESKPKFDEEIKLSNISIFCILKLKIKCIMFRKNILALIVNPYGLTERKYFLRPSKSIIKNFNLHNNLSEEKIVLHIRRGVQVDHVVPGEKTTRALNDDYFADKLKDILDFDSNAKLYELVILTDAPETTYSYLPISKDKAKWESEFFANMKDKSVLIQGHKFENLISVFPGTSRIIRGGDPQQAIDEMRSAKHFVMSRSSMSFIGAFLNERGTIYYPPNFWHKPLKNWIKCS